MCKLLIAATLALLVAGCGAEEEGGGETIRVSATDFALSPATVRVDEPGEVTFRFANDGGTRHALEIEGHGIEEETAEIAPGETAELTVELEAGEYVLYCPVDGHRDQGMQAALTIGGGAGGRGTGPTTTKDTGGYKY